MQVQNLKPQCSSEQQKGNCQQTESVKRKANPRNSPRSQRKEQQMKVERELPSLNHVKRHDLGNSKYS